MKTDSKKQNLSIGFEGLKEKEYGEIHKCVSEEIKKHKQELQSSIDKQFRVYFNGLQYENPLEKFCYALYDEMYWLCVNRQSANVATKHYGYFINALRKQSFVKDLDVFNAETFYNCIKLVSVSIKSPFPLGDDLANYVLFLLNNYEFYFYDESSVPQKTDDELFVFQKPIDFYHKWLNNCSPDIFIAIAKIWLDEMKKRSIGNDEYNILKKTVPINKDVEIDLSDIPATMYLIEVLQLSSFEFESKTGNKVPWLDMLTNLRWLYQTCEKLTFRDDNVLPLSVWDKSEYRSFGLAAKVGFNDFCNIFAYDIKDNKPYKFREKPFVQIGDVIFCPSTILSQYDCVYDFIEAFNVNVTSDNKKQQIRSQMLEEQLCKKLKNENWETIPLFGINNSSKGDADIILKDDKDVLLIQIKKPNFRRESKKKFEERELMDGKAASQLNEYEERNSSICDKNQRVTKWIVSSFENCRNEIDGCRKVSYLDLCFWYKANDYKELSQFIEDVQADKPIRDIIDAIKKKQSDFLRRELGEALPMVDPQSYIRRIKSNKGKDYFQWIGDLVEKFEWADSKEKLTIIDTIRKESVNHPNDYMLLIFLGICLRNIEDFCGAEESLKKVLEIVPDDPSTMRLLYNLYTQTLWRLRCNKSRFVYIKEEAGKIDKRFKELYWFVDEKNPKLDIQIKSFDR